MSKSALIIVDLQNDFCKGGTLQVPQGEDIVPLANEAMRCFSLVVATQDWHPATHLSFASNHLGSQVGDIIQLGGINQVLWPDHCIENSRGADFYQGFDCADITRIFKKGTNKEVDSYSAFFDNAHLKTTGLYEFLTQEAVTDLYVMGLATDYCVKFSVLDALSLGFRVYVIEDACRGVNLKPNDSEEALREMVAKGAIKIKLSDVISR